MDDCILVHSRWEGVGHGGLSEIIVPVSSYELGLRTRAALRKQLDLDLPRSVVHVRGTRVYDARAVLGSTPYARMCTQAVLAPPVEWLMHAGYVAHENGSGPMHVEVNDVGDVRVRKSLGVRDWSPSSRSHGDLHLDVHVSSETVVVGMHFQKK